MGGGGDSGALYVRVRRGWFAGCFLFGAGLLLCERCIRAEEEGVEGGMVRAVGE